MSDVLTNLQKLPEMCAKPHPYDGSVIIIRRGEMGYYPAPALLQYGSSGLPTAERIAAFNEAHGATPRHVAAMEAGSMFGWEIPAADVDAYTDDGKPLPAAEMRARGLI